MIRGPRAFVQCHITRYRMAPMVPYKTYIAPSQDVIGAIAMGMTLFMRFFFFLFFCERVGWCFFVMCYRNVNGEYLYVIRVL